MEMGSNSGPGAGNAAPEGVRAPKLFFFNIKDCITTQQQNIGREWRTHRVYRCEQRLPSIDQNGGVCNVVTRDFAFAGG